MKKKVVYKCEICGWPSNWHISVELSNGWFFSCPNCLAEITEKSLKEVGQIRQLSDEHAAKMQSAEWLVEKTHQESCSKCKKLFVENGLIDKEGGELSDSN